MALREAPFTQASRNLSPNMPAAPPRAHTRRNRRYCSIRRWRGRIAHDELGGKEQLLRADMVAIHLGHESINSGTSHCFDRLADGGEWRLSAAHERRVVVTDDRKVSGTERPAFRAARITPSAKGSLPQTTPVMPSANISETAAWPPSSEKMA